MSTGTSFFDQAPGPPPPPAGETDEVMGGEEPSTPKGGAPIHDPRELSKRANKRKGLVIGALGSVGLIVVVVMILGGGKDPATPQTNASGTAIADTGDVTVGQAGNTGLGIDTTSLSNLRAGGEGDNLSDLDIPEDLSSTLGGGGNLGPAPSLEGVTRASQNPTPRTESGAPSAGADLGVDTTPLIQPPANNAPLDLTGGGLLGGFAANTPTQAAPTTDEVAEEEEALRAQARADSVRADAEARLAARLAKLRGVSLTMLTGPAPEKQGDGAGMFGEPAPSGAASGNRDQEAIFVPMDASAPATMVTEFNSALTGNNVIAQLTAPLRVRGRVLLPAGTRAQGTASVRIGTRGTRTEVTMNFRTFILPNGERIQGYQAEAGDPRTMSRGLTDVGVNRHYPPQILGAVAASGFELLVGSLSRNRASTFEQPSVFDESVARVRDRGTSIFAGEFQEGRWEPTIRVERGTRVVLLFGLNETEVQPMNQGANLSQPGGLP